MEFFIETDVEQLTNKILKKVGQCNTEIEVRHTCQMLLEDFLTYHEIEHYPIENRTVLNGRPEHVFGGVVVEYKKPRKLEREINQDLAFKQCQEYINKLAKREGYDLDRYMAVIFDGFTVGFAQYKEDNWNIISVSSVDKGSIMELLQIFRSLQRYPLTPKSLNNKFGIETDIAIEAIRTLYDTKKNSTNPRTNVIFEEWLYVYQQVCGYELNKTKKQLEYIALKCEIKNFEPDILLFCLHTYLSIIVKYLAAEIGVIYQSSIFRSYLKDLLQREDIKFRNELKKFENGDVFAELGYKSFLDTDFFSWYLNEFSGEIESTIRSILSILIQFEPSIHLNESTKVQDLLKKFYQYMVPKELRHSLGEYYTPDWLAQYVIQASGYSGDLEERVLDPSCGSGTFLIFFLEKALNWGKKHKIEPNTLIEKLTHNIIGFDLNPLAVILS
ncbi:MAG: N-6 DNA methylase, partial [Candidatus Lokiarchaeota archaeon]|nr:N-6 DNA methylase [Candidatus Lokiarchaeota archaeon]